MNRSIDFENILREKLVSFLEAKNYRLVYDNTQPKKNEKSSLIFKLIFNGEKIIEVSNDDWRDYTEYFNFYLNEKPLFSVNIENYSDLEVCYYGCENTLRINL